MASYTDYKLLHDDEGRMAEEEEEGDLNLSQHYNYRIRKSPVHRYMDLFRKNSPDLESSQSGRTTGERRFSAYWPTQGTKKGLLMALTIGVILMVLVISAAVLVSNRAEDPAAMEPLKGNKVEKITINDVLSGKYSQRSFNGTWISDDEIQYFNEFADLLIYNVTDRNSTTILKGVEFTENLNEKRPFQCIFSPDREFILIAYDSQKVYRHSSNSKYEIYDTVKKSFQPLLPDSSDPQKRFLQLVEWAPSGNALAFVFDNNIYYKSAANLDTSVQLTHDGSTFIYNGITDWVYEEEMFGSSTAFWFSKNGTHLAFVTFNDTHVDGMPIIYYGEPGMLEYQYPVQETLSYPKAGRPNPLAIVTTVVLPTEESVKFTKMSFTDYPGVPRDHLIGSVTWTTDSELLVNTFNRVQNDSRVFLCNMAGTCANILTVQEPRGWVEVDSPKVSKNGSDFLILTSQKQTEFSYRHILLFNRKGEKKPITSGDFTVDAILSWDEENGQIYFTAANYEPTTKKLIASQSHMYYISDTGSNPGAVICLTCELKNTNNELCLSNSVELSTKGTHFIHSCNGPSIPEAAIRSVKNAKNVLKLWVNNNDLREILQQVALPTQRNYDIPVGNGFTAKARLWLPPNFNESHKYPLFVDVYGGPGSQKITDRFTIDWAMSLVSSRNIIYASFDGRGSGRQSDDFMFQVNRRLGTYEIEDQIEGARWLLKAMKFIDANRTAIWGWSYGGYATAMIMGKDKDGIYKCGISVAPVTSWLLYDTIYTERYMGLPTFADNLEAYNSSDVTNHVANFANKKFYLIHGNADDNVHYQQSMLLARALEKADILFRQQSYPEESHSLGRVRRHLYHSLEDFLFNECF